MVKRILVEPHNHEEPAEIEAFRVGFAYLQQGIGESACKADTVLFVPSYGNLQGSVFAKFLGHDCVERLMRAKTESLPEMSLRVATRRTYRRAQGADALIAAFVAEDELDVLDKIYGPRVIVVIPWTFKAGRYWDSKWSPMIVSLGELAGSNEPN